LQNCIQINVFTKGKHNFLPATIMFAKKIIKLINHQLLLIGLQTYKWGSLSLEREHWMQLHRMIPFRLLDLIIEMITIHGTPFVAL